MIELESLTQVVERENLCCTGLLISAILLCKAYLDKYRPVLHGIPTVGHSGRLTSFISASKLIGDGRQLFRKGYAMNPTGLFKIASFDRFEYVIAGGELVEDVKRAGDHEISFHEETVERMRFDYTIKSNIEHSLYHLKVVRTKMTSFNPLCDDLAEECTLSLKELVEGTNGEWLNIPLWDTVINLIGRTSSRVLVGLPLCRDREYLDLCIGFSRSIMNYGAIINMIPWPLRPLIGPWLSGYEEHRRLALKHLGPVVEERLKMQEEYGNDWEGKPEDLVTWLMDEATGEDATVQNLAMRVLFINFAAMHNTSMLLSSVLLDLAARPEYVETLREEAREISESEGWTKGAVAKMYKIDSFIRESARFSALASVSSIRKVCDPNGFKLSNGITLPYGTSLSIITEPVHHDPAMYDNPSEFNGSRFYELGKEELGRGDGAEYHVKHALASVTPTWLLWGVGKHACPGRFLAAHEIKVVIAQILLYYDIALVDGRRPDNNWVMHFCIPDRTARLLIRKKDSKRNAKS
ncbi:Ent-kaurene oxidase [Leucoagaricus sp. SymC.cos]|nr:Ent-kaurene oxidase [Leucoagaricus sp. SymC.cos]